MSPVQVMHSFIIDAVGADDEVNAGAAELDVGLVPAAADADVSPIVLCKYFERLFYSTAATAFVQNRFKKVGASQRLGALGAPRLLRASIELWSSSPHKVVGC